MEKTAKHCCNNDTSPIQKCGNQKDFTDHHRILQYKIRLHFDFPQNIFIYIFYIAIHDKNTGLTPARQHCPNRFFPVPHGFFLLQSYTKGIDGYPLAHPDFHGGTQPVTPSPPPFGGQIGAINERTGLGDMVHCPIAPRIQGIACLVEDYRKAVRNPILASAGIHGM